MLNFDRFEILTFDCYGTLIHWENGILPVLRRILQAHGKKVDDAALLERYGEFEQRAEQPPYKKYREVLKAVVRQFGNEFDFSATEAEQASLPDSVPMWQPWPDTVGALRRLGAQFRLVILSNIDDELFAATRPKLEVTFDEVITAEQARAYKPSHKMFELALERLKTSPERILHVGQSLYHDVVPAQALGLSTVWVNRPSARPGIGAVKSAQATPDLTVTSLDELASAVVVPMSRK